MAGRSYMMWKVFGKHMTTGKEKFMFAMVENEPFSANKAIAFAKKKYPRYDWHWVEPAQLNVPAMKALGKEKARPWKLYDLR
jgi:hypothetical protein